MIVWHWDCVLEDWTPGMAVAIADTYDDALLALAKRRYAEQSPRAVFHFSLEECLEWARENFPLSGCEQHLLQDGPFGAFCYGGG